MVDWFAHFSQVWSIMSWGVVVATNVELELEQLVPKGVVIRNRKERHKKEGCDIINLLGVN